MTIFMSDRDFIQDDSVRLLSHVFVFEKEREKKKATDKNTFVLNQKHALAVEY